MYKKKDNFCKFCNKEKTNDKNAHFCSFVCKRKYYDKVENCLNCNKQLTYQDKYCSYHCARIGHIHTEEMKLKNSLAHLGKKCSDLSKEKHSISLKKAYAEGRHKKTHSEETKNKLSISHLGKTLSEEHKNNIRIGNIKYMQNHENFKCPRIGKNEANILDKQEQKDNCKILRQYHLKDIGYFVDGYCPATNTVYEVYEKKHSKKSVQARDLKRQEQIQKLLDCDFKIIWDSNYEI